MCLVPPPSPSGKHNLSTSSTFVKKKIVKLDDIELNSLAFIGKGSVAIMYKKSFIDGACNNTRRIIKLVVTSAAV